MSTARGGEPRSGAQRLGEPGSFEPGLDHLITALTASPQPHELRDRDAALAAFREADRPPLRQAGLSERLRRSAGPRRPLRILVPARLAVAAAAVVAVLAGLTAAAAAQALPPSVQQIAYNVLAPLGVPVSQPMPAHPRPGPRPHSAATRGQAPPSAAVTIAATPSGNPGGPSPSASATPTRHHRARKVNAPVTQTVLLRLVYGKIDDKLIVAAPSAKAGETVNLTELAGTTWTIVASKPLGPRRKAVFILPATTAAGHLFEAELPQATTRTASASNPLWVPRRPHTGAKIIQPSPHPTTTPTPTPTPTGSGTTLPSPSPTTPATPPPPQTPPPPPPIPS